MSPAPRRKPLVRMAAAAATTTLLLALSTPRFAHGASPLVQVSADPYTNTTSQHQTQVEPDTFAFGSTVVSAFQSGRFVTGGASNIGWATSTDGGVTWTRGFLPGTTTFATPAGPFNRVSDPSVAYDAAHNVWLIASLPILNSGGVVGFGVIANRSTDGGMTWSTPVAVNHQYNTDKDWIVCDNTATSPHYGNCYVEWDLPAAGNRIYMSTSTNGGLTWGAPVATANLASGLGGQPLVEPNGVVVVPIDDASGAGYLQVFFSIDGGASWSKAFPIARIVSRTDPGNLRAGPLPSAEIDAAGKIYVVWEDCRFETGCSANDIVMVTLGGGGGLSAVTRIPIDPVGSGVDHVLPGLAVDPSTSGSSAHLALTYYYYPSASCTILTCRLDVGYVSSLDGGAHWSAPTQLAGPMATPWLANTSQGYMVGDYISTSIEGGTAHPVFAVAHAPSGGVFDEAMYSIAGGLPLTGGTLAASSAGVVAGAGSAQAGPGAATTRR